jgi:hypothetical protein
MLLTLVIWLTVLRTKAASFDSVAVLPFTNQGNNADTNTSATAPPRN